MRYLFFCSAILVITATEPLPAQISHRPQGAIYSASGTYSIKHPDAFSFTVNPAALARQKNAAMGIYGERKFLLEELSYYHAALVLPTPYGNFGWETLYSGSGLYNESQLGLAYARKLGSKADIGAGFNYRTLHISGYGNDQAIHFETGMILHITEQLHAGFHAENPVGGKFGKMYTGNQQQEKLPSVYTFGLGYDVSEIFFLAAEFVKEENKEVNINAGMLYRFLPQVFARAGISTSTSTAWLGIGINLKSFRIVSSGSFHPQLGITPGLLVLFHFNRKGNK